MKRLLFALLLMLPILATAKGPVDAKYLKGGVPEENGIIVFRKSFSVPNMPTEKIYSTLYNYVNKAVIEPAIHEQRTRILSDGKEDGLIVAKVEEYMTFTHVFLNLDQTRFIYQLQAQVEGNKVKLSISQISYYYNEDREGKNGITYRAEEWISDAEAVNKKGTKLYPRSGKFRIKTIDRVNDIFQKCMDAFEEGRKNVVED
jgi:colicin import membrane protein